MAESPAYRPSSLFLEITTECNLRCKQCLLWTTREPPGTLGFAEKSELIRQFAALAKSGMVTFHGGEPLLKPEELFGLVALARSFGLVTSTNTNGTLFEGDLAARMAASGPDYLAFSLDSHRAEVHDWIRGRQGTFAKTTEAIRAAVAAKRNAPGSPLRIMINAILCRETIGEVEGMTDFASALGVDGLLFQALSSTFANPNDTDPFFEANFPKDLAVVDRALDFLEERRGAGLLWNSQQDFAWMRRYFRDPAFTSDPVCGAAESNVIVDMLGNVQLCFSMRSKVTGSFLGNVRETSLAEILLGPESSDAKSLMSACRLNCGMLHCNRKGASQAAVSALLG
jgi:MoaA/NifB/PqqE/SkfB family radical SAM enzyme